MPSLPYSCFSSAFPFLLLLFSSLLLLPVSTEKTLCEQKLAEVPANVFYYQRTEAVTAAECAERCVDDWEFCKSALLVHQNGKSLCQLYGTSFEPLLPLKLPQPTSTLANPGHLPISLIEIADPPCSSKFSLNSELTKLVSPTTMEALNLIARPSSQNFRIGRLEDEKNLGGRREEEEEQDGLQDEDMAYFTPRPAPKFAEQKGEDEEENVFRQGLPSFPPTPIRPTSVSRGRLDPFSSGSCRDGFCPPRVSQPAAIASYHSSGEMPCAASKSTDPCAPQAHWMEWTPGSCSVTCGVGNRQRRRYCSSGKQKDCQGMATDTEKCVMPVCDQWTEWTDWSRCSTSCGGGKRTRQRMCRNGVKCTGPSVDSRSCNEQFCPSWTEWAEWGQCSASCGRGIQRRGRVCEPAEGQCGGLATEYRECELRTCPSWGDWEPWSSCSKSCGGGESVRQRACENGVADDCRGPAVEHLLCNTQPCPSWSPWSEWGSCSKSCGEGSVKTRRRECRYNGLPSDDCPGSEEGQADCRLGVCPHWADWSAWTECSTTCGHGRQSRSRECKPNGFGCSGGDREIRFCQKAVCPYFDNWTEWGGCSVTCGRGFCERRRRCIKDADLGRKLPTDEEEHRSGGKKGRGKGRLDEDESAENESGQGGSAWTVHGGNAPLPEDITAADSLAPQTLQVAQSAATRAIDRRRSPLISSKLTLRDTRTGDCIGPEVERKPCDAGPCCEWNQWSSWSNCRVRCGNSGFRERSRSCEFEQNYNQPPTGHGHFPNSFGFGGLNAAGQCPVCVGEAQQTESCAIPESGKICEDERQPRRELKARPLLREGREDGGTQPLMRDTEQGPKRKAMEAGGKGEGKEEEEEGEAEDCYWAEWTAWSVCDPKNQLRNRSRVCAGLRGLSKDCQCQGPFLEQIPCSTLAMPTPPTLEPQLRTKTANSLIKRLQLIPRHKQSEAERQRRRERNSSTPRTVEVDEPSGKCGEWMEWQEWGHCTGKCGTGVEGTRSRTRECHCGRNCAGIAEESVSCQLANC